VKQQENKTSTVPFFRSLQAKYALTYMAVIAVVLLLLNTYPLFMAENMVYQSKESTLKRQALAIGTALGVTENLTAEGVEQAVLLLEELSASRILVTDGEGLVLYDTSEGETSGYDTALLWSALKGYDVFSCEYREGAIWSTAAVPVVCRGVTLGAEYLYEYDTEQAELLLSIQSNLRYMSIIICCLALLASLVLSKALTRNVGQLLAAIRTVREGEYSHRVTLKSRDELAQLADEFNQLTGRLQTTEEARRRFVSDASHELKTPLASIRLLTDSILQTDNVDMDTVKEFVADIGEEADRLTRISEKLLTLTRLDSLPEPERETVELGAVVERVAHMLRPLAEAVGIELKCDIQPGCSLLCTQDDLYQIIFNLVENAIKYNLPGGTVEVTGSCRGGRVALKVSDTGVGIPEEDMPKIFDRFYRVDKARSRAAGGTGLGLSIVSDTVKVHGGTIAGQRRGDGTGTIFTVTFPAASTK
jgi:signal transduction histidine kinase